MVTPTPPTSPTTHIAAVVARALDNAGITRLQAAEQTAIPRTTLTRKMRTGDFTVAELAAISQVLGCTVADLFTEDAA